MATHAQRKTWRNGLDERVELVLLLHGEHDGLEVLSDVRSERLRQVDILHGCVSHVDDFLLLLRFTTDLCNQHSQLTENVGLENGTSQVNDDHKDDLWELLWPHFIATDDKHRVVEANDVKEDLSAALLVFEPVVVCTIIVVIRGNPWLVTIINQGLFVSLLNKEEPKACDQVKVDDEEHVVVQHLHQNLGAFLHVRLRDQRRDSQHTVNLEDTYHGQYRVCAEWVVQQRQQIDPETDRVDVVSGDFARLDYLDAETVEVGRS